MDHNIFFQFFFFRLSQSILTKPSAEDETGRKIEKRKKIAKSICWNGILKDIYLQKSIIESLSGKLWNYFKKYKNSTYIRTSTVITRQYTWIFIFFFFYNLYEFNICINQMKTAAVFWVTQHRIRTNCGWCVIWRDGDGRC